MNFDKKMLCHGVVILSRLPVIDYVLLNKVTLFDISQSQTETYIVNEKHDSMMLLGVITERGQACINCV